MLHICAHAFKAPLIFFAAYLILASSFLVFYWYFAAAYRSLVSIPN